ncbi:beta-lactamase family protein [Porticoccaceae bacterium]|nr:beta-lactamase family protein [Porticoccaceae bacterium]
MNFDALDTLIRQQMRKRKTPGLAIAVTKDDKVIYSKGFGARNLKQYLPMTADTLIGIGSVTKSFTAMAMVRLQEMGLLSIEDSVSKYLKVEPFTSRPEIKIKHMLSHSSGIPTMDGANNSFHYAFDDFSRVFPAESREDFLAHLGDAGDFIIYKPGEHFFYNNDCYTCLTFIVEDLTGKSFEAFLREVVLEPLAMKRAVMNQADFDNDPENNMMTGYLPDVKDGKPVVKASAMPMAGWIKAPGGIYASMNEMIHYAQCLLNSGAYGGQQVVEAASVTQLFAPQMATPYGRGDDPQYSLGWCRSGKTPQIPHEVIGHGGGMLTSSSNFVLVPELNLGIVVAENCSTGICPLVTDAVIATVLGDNPAEVIEDLRIAQAIDDIEGVYMSAHDMYSFRVYREGGVIKVDAEIDDGFESFTMVGCEIDKLVFSKYSLREDNKSRIEFLRNTGSGKVEYVTYDRYLYRRV